MDAVSTFCDVEDPWNIQCRKSPYGCEYTFDFFQTNSL
jgi:hypothetical protein